MQCAFALGFNRCRLARYGQPVCCGPLACDCAECYAVPGYQRQENGHSWAYSSDSSSICAFCYCGELGSHLFYWASSQHTHSAAETIVWRLHGNVVWQTGCHVYCKQHTSEETPNTVGVSQPCYAVWVVSVSLVATWICRCTCIWFAVC